MSSSLCRILNFWAAPSLFPHDAALRWNGKMLLSHVFTNQRWQQYSWIIVTTGVNDNVCWPSQHNTLHHQLWRGRVNRGRESENKLQLKSSVWLSAAQMWLGGGETHLTLVTGCWFRFASTDRKWQAGISLDDLLRKAVSHLGNRTRCVISRMCHSYRNIYRQC